MYQVFASISEPVALSPREALDSAEALMTQQGYNVTERTDTSVTAVRRKREGIFGHSLRDLTVVAQPLPQGGVQIKLRGNDREGDRNRANNLLSSSRSPTSTPQAASRETTETG